MLEGMRNLESQNNAGSRRTVEEVRRDPEDGSEGEEEWKVERRGGFFYRVGMQTGQHPNLSGRSLFCRDVVHI